MYQFFFILFMLLSLCSCNGGASQSTPADKTTSSSTQSKSVSYQELSNETVSITGKIEKNGEEWKIGDLKLEPGETPLQPGRAKIIGILKKRKTTTSDENQDKSDTRTPTQNKTAGDPSTQGKTDKETQYYYSVIVLESSTEDSNIFSIEKFDGNIRLRGKKAVFPMSHPVHLELSSSYDYLDCSLGQITVYFKGEEMKKKFDSSEEIEVEGKIYPEAKEDPPEGVMAPYGFYMLVEKLAIPDKIGTTDKKE